MGILADLLLTEEEQNPKPKGKLYCDMDGVLTDFDERFDHYFEMLPAEYEERKGKAGFWSAIAPIGQIFWEGMEWTPYGKVLWKHIQDFNPTLLTAPSSEQSSTIINSRCSKVSGLACAKWSIRVLTLSSSAVRIRQR